MTEPLQALRSFIVAETPGDLDLDQINDETNLITAGILDSLAIINLVQFVEERFSITLSDADISPENFSTLGNLASLVQEKRHQRVSGGATEG